MAIHRHSVGAASSRRAASIALVLLLFLGLGAATGMPAAPAPDQANLWVDPSGGRCVRSAAPREYADAAACGSLNAAYQAAAPGDLVRIASGTYADQNIRGKAKAAAPAVVMQPGPGATVVVQELDVSADWLTLRNLTIVPAQGRGGNDKILDVDHGAEHLTFDRIRLDGRIGGTRQVRDGLGISGDTDYVTVRNSDICCIQDQKLIQIQTYGTSVQNRHLTFAGNMIHDDWQTSSDVHLECLWLEGISDFLFSGNHFYDCALNAILANADEGGTLANWTIVNNVFEAADAGAAGIPQDIDGCAETHAKANWLVAYNYIATGFRFTSCGGELDWLTMRGNIGARGDFNCGKGGVWEYNIWTQRRCSATDRQVREITSLGNYVAAKADGATGPGDYHPASARSPQANAGHPLLWPTTDAGRKPRPLRVSTRIVKTKAQVRVEGSVVPARRGLRVGLTIAERRQGAILRPAVKRPLLGADSTFTAVFSRRTPGACMLSATVPGYPNVSATARADAGPYEREAKGGRPLERRFSC